MRQAVIVRFDPHTLQEIDLHAHTSPLAADAARRWLDDAFLAHDCEPLRPTGKVLIADKMVALAEAVGPTRLAQDADWAQAFARAVLGALGRPVVMIDVPDGRVGD